MKRELGDIMWYMSQACMALDISIEEVIQMNFEKLSARYPEGTFSIERSENRGGRSVSDFKIPFAIVSLLLVQGAGAVWWSS